MTDPAWSLERYLAGVEPATQPLVRSLDAATRRAHPGFDTDIKYRILMYALGADWRHWVTALDARRATVSLRFLYAVLLRDPRHVLRSGTSVLMTWDFKVGDDVDAEAVGSYVQEAVRQFDYFRANTAEVLARSRAAAVTRGRK